MVVMVVVLVMVVVVVVGYWWWRSGSDCSGDTVRVAAIIVVGTL